MVVNSTSCVVAERSTRRHNCFCDLTRKLVEFSAVKNTSERSWSNWSLLDGDEKTTSLAAI